MTEAEVVLASWWASFWTEIEHWAFLAVVIALVVEFVALRLAARHHKALEKANELQIAQLEKAASEANERALAAQLALEKFRKPWTLPIWRLPDFEKLLAPYPGTPYRIMATGDHDAQRIAQILKRAFDWAQWTPATPLAMPTAEGVELIPDFNGLSVRVSKNRAPEWLPAAQAIAAVFGLAEIEVEARVMESGIPDSAIDIIIGRKV